MKKSLLFISFMASISLLADVDSLKKEKDTLKKKIKTYRSEIELYKKSIPAINSAKGNVAKSKLIVSDKTLKMESLTGVVIKNGTTSYNHNPSSNHDLEAANNILQSDIDDLTLQNKLIDESIVAARETLGEMRTKVITPSIRKNISFYQGKISDYKQELNKNERNIKNKNRKIESNKNIIVSNSTQINSYKTKVDAAQKVVLDNQATIKDWTEKLKATPDKIDFNSVSTIENEINQVQDQIDYLDIQIADEVKDAKKNKQAAQ